MATVTAQKQLRNARLKHDLVGTRYKPKHIQGGDLYLSGIKVPDMVHPHIREGYKATLRNKVLGKLANLVSTKDSKRLASINPDLSRKQKEKIRKEVSANRMWRIGVCLLAITEWEEQTGKNCTPSNLKLQADDPRARNLKLVLGYRKEIAALTQSTPPREERDRGL